MPGVDTFTWRGIELPYLDHAYNSTALNERAVEVPIARHWIAAGEQGDGLEVGNVLSHYGSVRHRIVDLHEQAIGVHNLDLFDELGSYDWIVAISTVEHVRWEQAGAGMTRWEEEPDPVGPIEAIWHLRGLLKPGGRLLVTVPFGQHPYLDGAILSGGLEPTRESTMIYEADCQWTERPGPVWRPARRLRWAGAVWVATWLDLGDA